MNQELQPLLGRGGREHFQSNPSPYRLFAAFSEANLKNIVFIFYSIFLDFIVFSSGQIQYILVFWLAPMGRDRARNVGQGPLGLVFQSFCFSFPIFLINTLIFQFFFPLKKGTSAEPLFSFVKLQYIWLFSQANIVDLDFMIYIVYFPN